MHSTRPVAGRVLDPPEVGPPGCQPMRSTVEATVWKHAVDLLRRKGLYLELVPHVSSNVAYHDLSDRPSSQCRWSAISISRCAEASQIADGFGPELP